MALPFFYAPTVTAQDDHYTLEEESSRHAIQVLRMRLGDQLQLTNGLGGLFVAEIIDDHKKRCAVSITSFSQQPGPVPEIAVGISLLKNTHRFEWFLEKATEIGITEIIPVLCQRTEKQHFRLDRMKNILVTAILQSQQSWLPKLQEPQPIEKIIREKEAGIKLIAHCGEGDKQDLRFLPSTQSSKILILIGPEGDFSAKEIELAITQDFKPVSLGNTRLRTETAGMVAVALLRNSVAPSSILL
jgi:16S rRNA (uracil1498-N3)-methyltransferase